MHTWCTPQCTPGAHLVCTKFAPSVHQVCTRCSLFGCAPCDHCSPGVHQVHQVPKRQFGNVALNTWCTPGAHPSAHLVHTWCAPSLHQVCTRCAPGVHYLGVHHVITVHQVCTRCAPGVHWGVHQVCTRCSELRDQN